MSEIQGTNNIIEVRGHADPMELNDPHTETETFPDLWTLSYARARAVMIYLTQNARPLSPDRFELIADGARDTVRPRAMTVLEQAANRRAEIVVNESLMGTPDPATPDEPTDNAPESNAQKP